MPAAPLKVVALAVGSCPTVAGLAHVLRSIVSYLDWSGLLPLHEACSSGPIRLLDRIWENSDPVTLDKASRWSLSQHLRTDKHYYRYQFSKCLRAAVKKGDLEIVRWILDHFLRCTADVEVVEDAAFDGQVEILQYLLEYDNQGDEEDLTRNAISWGGEDVTCAIRNGRLDVAQWLYENTPEAHRDFSHAMQFAVRRGEMASIQWLLDVVYRLELHLPPPAMNDAAAGGHIEILEWIHEQGYDGGSDHALAGAVRNGRLDMLEWLVERGITEIAYEAVDAACVQGHLPILRWLHERSLGRNAVFAMKIAIWRGHLDVVKYLYGVDTRLSPSSMMKEAASNGRLDVVQWLYETHDSQPFFPPFDSSYNSGWSNQTAMDQAASFGHFHVLKYLHSIAAAMKADGKSGGPTCSEWAFPTAAERGHLEIVKWLHDTYPQQCRSPHTTNMAARSGRLELLQWLHENTNCVWTSSVMDDAASSGQLSLVQWLHGNRSEGCTTAAMDRAAGLGHLDVVRWLHYNRAEGCTTAAMDGAANCGHFEVMLFLHAERTESSTMATKLRSLGHDMKHIPAWLEEHFRTSDR